MKTILYIFLLTLFTTAQACPICSVTLGAAAVSAKYFGLDLTIFGLFIGATTIPTSHIINSLIKKNYFKGQKIFIALVLFLVTFLFVYFFDPGIGTGYSKIYWRLKLGIGFVVGSLVTVVVFWLNAQIKKNISFKFQKTVFTLVLLGLTSIILQMIFAENNLLELIFYLNYYL